MQHVSNIKTRTPFPIKMDSFVVDNSKIEHKRTWMCQFKFTRHNFVANACHYRIDWKLFSRPFDVVALSLLFIYSCATANVSVTHNSIDFAIFVWRNEQKRRKKRKKKFYSIDGRHPLNYIQLSTREKLWRCWLNLRILKICVSLICWFVFLLVLFIVSPLDYYFASETQNHFCDRRQTKKWTQSNRWINETTTKWNKIRSRELKIQGKRKN